MRRYLQTLARLYRMPVVQVGALTLLTIFFSAIAVFYFEGLEANANINSVWDGVWWAVVTMGTVGYGDKYPVTAGGRVVGILLIFSGIGLMSLFTATIASVFVERRIKEGKGLDKVKIKDHIIICGWNQHTEETLQGLTVYGKRNDVDIVLINELSVDDIDTLRMKYGKYKLKFLRGNYVHEDVLVRANVAKAAFVLIMADTSGNHPRDRIDERTTLAALAVKSLAPNVKTIAELLDGENKAHLKRANVDEIIVRGEHVGSLLAAAVHSPGLPRAVSQIMSLGDRNKLRSVTIPTQFIGRTFRELWQYFRDSQQSILIGLLKEKKTMKLEDLLSDNTSIIDTFIREKIREAKRDFTIERDAVRVIINPGDDHTVEGDDVAIVIVKTIPS
ncbi:MAG: ion channel [Syntrophales bacterium]|nr:ion channel [Syntrophales bacterium]